MKNVFAQVLGAVVLLAGISSAAFATETGPVQTQPECGCHKSGASGEHPGKKGDKAGKGARKHHCKGHHKKHHKGNDKDQQKDQAGKGGHKHHHKDAAPAQ